MRALGAASTLGAILIACTASHGADAGRLDSGAVPRDGGAPRPRDGGPPAIDAACTPWECGDGVCTPGGEDCVICTRDCGECPCGDGVCSGTERCSECPGDCGPCPCGDGSCDIARGETCTSCLADCGCDCADGRCGPQEWEVCPAGSPDCGFVDFCGNRRCEDRYAEDCLNCPWDCCCR